MTGRRAWYTSLTQWLPLNLHRDLHATARHGSRRACDITQFSYTHKWAGHTVRIRQSASQRHSEKRPYTAAGLNIDGCVHCEAYRTYSLVQIRGALCSNTTVRPTLLIDRDRRTAHACTRHVKTISFNVFVTLDATQQPRPCRCSCKWFAGAAPNRIFRALSVYRPLACRTCEATRKPLLPVRTTADTVLFVYAAVLGRSSLIKRADAAVLRHGCCSARARQQ